MEYKLTNQDVKVLQEQLHEILNQIDMSMDVVKKGSIKDVLEPIKRLTVDISDKVFVQTKDSINIINL